VLIIDDGQLDASFVDEWTNRLADTKMRYLRKSHNPGLFKSRLLAVSTAIEDVILFLDDDIELSPRYLSDLMELWTRVDHNVVGIGGLDPSWANVPRYKMLWHRLFLTSSGAPGRLSPSGFNLSMFLWPQQKAIFDSQFMTGCNMSFRREVLLDLPTIDWLERYSLGEDIILSLHAGRRGRIVIDPRLTVCHHEVPISRPSLPAAKYRKIYNHFRVMEMSSPSMWRRLAFAWSLLGFLLADAFGPDRQHTLPSDLAAIRDILAHGSPATQSGSRSSSRSLASFDDGEGD
jgi:glycosyltransferase involved in cell wall biosynthesis